MGLRRIAAGDQRRRRVLIEESLSVVSAEADPDQPRPPTSKPGSVTGNSYSDAVCLPSQSSSVILLASRPFTLTVTALSSLVLLVGLLAAYGHWRLWPQDQLPSPLSVLDLERPGNLAAWLCSLLLAAAAFQAVQIYRLRRHKTDDYRGRYRVWVWIPLLLFAMAAGQATDVHQDLVHLAATLVSPKAGLEHAATWPLIAALIWVLVAVRLTFEMRVSRWATAFLVIATVGYLAGLTTAQLTVQPISQILVVFASSALLAIGHVGVFVSILVFGHHVYLDSQGLLPARAIKPRRTKTRIREAVRERKKSSRKTADAPVQVEQPEETAADSPESPPPEVEAPVLQLGTRRDEPANEDDDDDSATTSSGEKLSKTERRRLKKLRQQEQMRRAA
jgi:hypothetical protein